MPVNITDSVNDLGEQVLKNDTVRNILSNPLALAVVLTIIFALIVILCSADVFTDDNGKPSIIYVSIMSFILLLTTIMFSHQAIRDELRGGQHENFDHVVGSGENNLPDDEVIPAEPDLAEFDFSL